MTNLMLIRPLVRKLNSEVKPFPSSVNWFAVWKHRYLFLNLLNQIAYGDRNDCRYVVAYYGGIDLFADQVYSAARQAIEVK